ncbi:hypothetical protein TSA6c_17270 [Azospirillum sp. TSA6c]|nr:hypothetical protein TSA6c_17270 [Azospirillum sp. TSA6c]
MDGVVSALRSLRLTKVGLSEAEIHQRAEDLLQQHGFVAEHEFRIAPRCRLDFWIPVAGIAIEFKKGRPSKAAVVEQLGRYADLPEVQALVLVLEQSMVLAREIGGKPVRVVSLNTNWGIC